VASFLNVTNDGEITAPVSVNSPELKIDGDSVAGLLDQKEDVIGIKGTAFNKDFGTETETVAEGDHNHEGVYAEPIGTIRMHTGQWINNITIPGWYCCDGNNGTPNLVGRFIIGSGTPGVFGGTAGSTYTITNANLPRHWHTNSHAHNLSNNNVTANNRVAAETQDHTHTVPTGTGIVTITTAAFSETHHRNARTSGRNATHDHVVYCLAGGTGTGWSGGVATPAAISVAPANYSVIFIMRRI